MIKEYGEVKVTQDKVLVRYFDFGYDYDTMEEAYKAAIEWAIKRLQEELNKEVQMSKWRPEGWDNPYPDLTEEAITEKYLIQALENPKTNYEIFEAGADAMLESICEEIKKVENPYKDMVFLGDYQNGEFQGFREAKQEILSLLRSEKVV